MVIDCKSKGGRIKVQRIDDEEVDSLVERRVPSKDLGAEREYALRKQIEFDYEDSSRLYFDIETENPEGKFEIGKGRILSFAAVDDSGNKFKKSVNKEKEILKFAKNLFGDYEMIIGFNSGGFDYPFLLERGKKNEVNFKKFKRYHLDLYQLMKKIQLHRKLYQKENIINLKLETLGKELLGLEKINLSHQEKEDLFRHLFDEHRDLLQKYNLRDSEITKGLDEKFNLVGVFEEIAKLSHIPIYEIKTGFNKAIENMIVEEILERSENQENLKYYWKRLSKYSTSKRDTTYKGAWIKEPQPSLYQDVLVLDISSQYPNILRTMNISFETLKRAGDVDSAIEVKGYYFTQIFEGVLASLADRLLDLKKEAGEAGEQTRRQAVKIVANAIIGYFGSRYSKFRNIYIPRAVTKVSRTLMKKLEDDYKQSDNPVRMSDTDSIFLSNIKLEEAKDLEEEINTQVKNIFLREFGVQPEDVTLSFGIEKHYSKLLVQGKKRYVGRLDYKDGEKVNQLDYTGIELVEKEKSKFTKSKLRGLINSIFEGRERREIFNEVIEIKNELLSGEAPKEDLANTKRISKEFDSYKSPPLHARIAEEEDSPYFKGQDFTYLITGKVDKLKGVSLEKAQREDISYNPKCYWERRLFPAIKRCLNVVYPKCDISELETSSRVTEQINLGEFGE